MYIVISIFVEKRYNIDEVHIKEDTMRQVFLEHITGNEILAQAIMDENGRILLSKGMHIKQSYLNKLYEIGINAVYVEDEISEGIEVKSILSQETKLLSKKVIRDESQRFIDKNDIDLSRIRDIAGKIIDEILENRTTLANISDIRIKDEYLFSHCVNVCGLALFFANKIGLDYEQLKSLALGCIIHDIGKILIPKEILTKKRPTSKELEELKQHVNYGYKMLESDFSVSSIARVVVLMHHEQEDGKGYLGIPKEKIHQCVKICSICNAFDNANHREFNLFLNTSYAIRYLQSNINTKFDEALTKEFLKYIPVYTPGCIVLLNNGTIGIVVKNNQQDLTRPVVRLLYNAKTKIKYQDYEIDLSRDPRLTVEREIIFNKKEYDSITKVM